MSREVYVFMYQIIPLDSIKPIQRRGTDAQAGYFVFCFLDLLRFLLRFTKEHCINSCTSDIKEQCINSCTSDIKLIVVIISVCYS